MGPQDYDYELPSDRIAQTPAAARPDSRMMVLRGQQRLHRRAADLPSALPEGALVVVNDSKVVPARLHLRRESDGRVVELLFVDPGAAPLPGRASPAGQGPRTVLAWVRGAKKLRDGDVLSIAQLRLRLVDRPAPEDPRARVFELLQGELLPTLYAHGQVPLPPYIDRPEGPTPTDAERYQTVYADKEGSIAAPTAGLHLTRELLERLDVVALTLHVGPGTFLPMDVQDVRQHRVGAERVELSHEVAARIEAARTQNRPIVAVGTTVTRALESAVDPTGRVAPLFDATDLMITPGFRFGVVTHLLTNFHLPRSSLLMLVCTFGGRPRVLQAYREAVARGYRFYSYGDCMLLDRDGLG